MKTNKNSVSIEPMDERQRQITQKAMAFGFIFLMVCMVIATVYKIATTGDVGWELFAIIGAFAVILISRRLMGDVGQPLDYQNRLLPTGSSKAERLVRCKNYAVNSLIFGLTFAVIDSILLIAFGENDVVDLKFAQALFPDLSKGATIAVSAIITFVTMFLVSFLFEYLIGEFFKVKRYNKMMAQLDAEEQE